MNEQQENSSNLIKKYFSTASKDDGFQVNSDSVSSKQQPIAVSNHSNETLSVDEKTNESHDHSSLTAYSNNSSEAITLVDEEERKPATVVALFSNLKAKTPVAPIAQDQNAYACDDQDYIECEKCKKRILVWEMPEHSDYHFALDLYKHAAPSREPIIKPTSILKSTKRKETDKTESSAGSKKSKKNPSETVKSIKPLENYFKKA
jgi:hypothetical protein